jgi:hypothetical protein
VGEVTGAQPAGLVDLGEEDLLGRPDLSPPPPDVPLQGPQLAVGEAAGIAPLQLLEDGLGLQAGIDLQQGTDRGPHLREGVGPGPPGVQRGQCAGELTFVQVFASRLLVHVSQQGATGQSHTGGLEAEQFADLFVRDHAQASSCKGLALAYGPTGPGNLIVVRTRGRCRRGADADPGPPWQAKTISPGSVVVVVVVVREIQLSSGGRNSCR